MGVTTRPRSDQGSKVGQSLRAIQPILRTWLRVQNEYGEYHSWDEASWIFNERASLSMFAAAVWRAGGIALEEYSIEKRLISRRRGAKRSRRSTGRCDLWFCINKHDFIVEAKPSWPSLVRLENWDGIESTLSDALEAVSRNLRYARVRRLALVLIAPALAKHRRKDADALIRRFIERLRLLRGCAVAWTFPVRARNRVYADLKLYPGAALLIKPLG